MRPALSGRARSLGARLLPVVLCTGMVAQLLLEQRRNAVTADEPTHLYAGHRALRCGDLSFSAEHPPLARLVAAAALGPGFRPDCGPYPADAGRQALHAQRWLFSQQWRTGLQRARAAMALFAVLLFAATWRLARGAFGGATALVATLLLAFDPVFVGHGLLVLTDAPAAATVALAFCAFGGWLRAGGRWRLAAAGGAAGLAMLTKHSGIVVLPAMALLACLAPFVGGAAPGGRGRRALASLAGVAVAGVLALVVVGAGYRLVRLAAPTGAAAVVLTDSAPALLHALDRARLLPTEYLAGVAPAADIVGGGGPVWAAGSFHARRPWYYLPLTGAVRFTLPSLLLLALAATGGRRAFGAKRAESLLLLLPAAVFLALAAVSNTAIVARHLLPAVPLLAVATAAGAVALAARSRPALVLVSVLVGLHAASSLRQYPDRMAFASEVWGGPLRAWRQLPWTDMGQGYLAAAAHLRARPGEPCWLLTDWHWDPSLYDVPCRAVGPYLDLVPPRLEGTVLVSSTLPTRADPFRFEMAAPFRDLEPVDQLANGALLVFRGTFDASRAAGAALAHRAAVRLYERLPDEAAALLDDAVRVAPSSPVVRASRCERFAAEGRTAEALAECRAAAALARQAGDPVHLERVPRLDATVAGLAQEAAAAPQ